MALDARREQVSHLFGRGSKESNRIVMQCLGYVLPDESKMGLVFRPPLASLDHQFHSTS